MRGYGLTVFRGTEPERFDVEVIDVLRNFRPDQDLILVRTDHPILDHASTVAGMSGSPIYLDGRLAGAYAYGWPFGKDPVAGVTPIANMLAELRRPVRPNAFPGAEAIPGVRPRPSATARPARRARLAGLPPFRGLAPSTGRFDALAPLRAHGVREGLPSPSMANPRGLVRASTPLMLGGFSDGIARLLGDRLEPLGILALQAGGGSNRGTPGAQFVDGGAIAVQLVRGDVSATAVGTVTHVAGRRLVAFGHPMMNAGELGLPTATARVLHVLASESRSFKIAEAAGPLGTMVHDRQAAIVVDSGIDAETVPVRVRIRGIDGAPRTEWNMEVASHRVLTPMLTFAAIANAVEATAADQSDVIFVANERITLAGRSAIELEDTGYMSAGPNDTRALSSLRMFEVMEAAFGNPFEETRVRSIELDLNFRFDRDVFEIVDAAVASDEVDPGSNVTVRIVMRRFGAAPRIRTVSVRIPTSAAGQTVELVVEPGDDVAVEQPLPVDLDDMLTAVRNRYAPTQLAVSVKMPSRGLRFESHVVRSLPGSALDTLQLENDTSRGLPFVTYARQLEDFGHVLAGSARLSVRVRERPRR